MTPTPAPSEHPEALPDGATRAQTPIPAEVVRLLTRAAAADPRLGREAERARAALARFRSVLEPFRRRGNPNALLLGSLVDALARADAGSSDRLTAMD